MIGLGFYPVHEAICQTAALIQGSNDSSEFKVVANTMKLDSIHTEGESGRFSNGSDDRWRGTEVRF